jgi:hypothetical protein
MTDAEIPIVVRDRRHQKIELSTVYWYTGSLPPVIDVNDCSLRGLAPDAFHAFYGTRGKQDGFMAARAYALSSGQDYTAIDLSVSLECELPRQFVTEADIANLDFLPVHRLAQTFADDLDYRLRTELHIARRHVSDDGAINALQHTLSLRPRAAKTVLDFPEFRHIKAIVYAAKLSISEDTIPIATIPERHMGSIVAARSRLDPGLVIKLHSDGPTAADKTGVGSCDQLHPDDRPKGQRVR